MNAGRTVPWLLPGETRVQYVGITGVDLGLDWPPPGSRECARLVETMREHGYIRPGNVQRNQLMRAVTDSDDKPDFSTSSNS